MRMDGQEESSNVEDVRGMGGGGGGFSFGGRGLSIGGIVIAVIVGWIFGINPLQLLGMMDGSDGGTTVQQQGPAPAPPKDDPGARFVSRVLRSTEQVWGDVFRESGRTYQPPKLVLFSGSWPTACGQGQAAMGPFYCPEDRKVYIDLNFYRVLEQKLGAPGEFAQAYVVAHEVGHHVQNLLGVTGSVDQRDPSSSVAVELQADCLAGVWGNDAQKRGLIENGDLDEGLNAAASVGDDVLMAQAGQTVNPDNFTHGSAEERASWLLRGFNTGSPDSCDTFAAA